MWGIPASIPSRIFPLRPFGKIFLWRNSPYWATASSFLRIHDHTQTHHGRLDSSAREISPSQWPLPDNTQHSQETDIHAPVGIRVRNSSKREAAEPRLGPRGHWDRLLRKNMKIKMYSFIVWPLILPGREACVFHMKGEDGGEIRVFNL